MVNDRNSKQNKKIGQNEILKSIVKYSHKNLTPFSVTLICIYALYLRIVSLYRHTLWLDELCQLGQMRGSFLDLLKSLQKSDVCSFLEGDHYLIYPFFKIFSYNKWGLAIPHIIATVIGFYILYLICKRYFRTTWAYLITFSIVCFNATLIYHATEIRPYAVLPTLALAAFYLFQKMADLNFKLKIPKKTAAAIFFVLVIWFHVYGILIFISCFLFALSSKYKENDFKIYFKNAVSFAVIILCVVMPLWLYCVFGPRLDITGKNLNLFEYIPNPFHNIAGFLKGVFCNLIGFKKLYFLCLGALMPFVFSYADRRKQLLFLFFNILMPIAFVLLFVMIGKGWFIQRYFIWVMPLFAFFLGWTWDSCFVLLKHGNAVKDK